MGKPSQYTDEEEEEPAPKETKKQQKNRRFYRDHENAILGGIAGGLASYFNLDVTVVRIILVLLVFLGIGFIVPIYNVVWFVAPAALTASQRLEMQGEDVTVENIKTEINNVKNYMESEKFKKSASNVGERILEILRWFFKILFGFVGGILGLIGIILIGALILALFILIFEPSLFHGVGPDLFLNWALIPPEKMILLIISLILIVGCPLFILIHGAIKILSGRHENNHTALWVGLLLWIAGLFMFFSTGAGSYVRFHNQDGHFWGFNWSDNSKPFVDEVRKVEPFHAVEISGNFELVLNKDSAQNIIVSSPQDFMSEVVTNVENGVLHIYSDQILINRTLKVSISSDSLKSLTAKGACKIQADSQLISPNFSLILLGASQADLNLNVNGTINLELKEASKVDLKGSCNTFKINGNGASEIDAEDLKAENVDVHLSSASQARVFASKKIDAEANGSSKIDCTGHPATIKKVERGSSNIRIE
jgi:phage shock protein PspC (stress-responsive transcriptional regulator)